MFELLNLKDGTRVSHTGGGKVGTSTTLFETTEQAEKFQKERGLIETHAVRPAKK